MPYRFSPAVNQEKEKLDTGDYSVRGNFLQCISVTVERKTLADFIGSVIHHRYRFMAEVERMSHFEWKCIVVEGSISQILNHDYDSGAHPNSIIGSAIAICVDFGIPVYFFENRQIAELWVENFLIRAWKRTEVLLDGNSDGKKNRDVTGESSENISQDAEEISWFE